MINSKKKWLLAYTKSGQENRAKENLENQGFQTFLPRIAQLQELKSLDYKFEPMFPRYLFISIDPEEQNWNAINSTKGVNNLVIFGDSLSFVPSEVISLLRSYVDDNDVYFSKSKKKIFSRGDKVSISKGIFKDLDAIFLSHKAKDRVIILLKSLNHIIPTEIPSAHLKDEQIISAFKVAKKTL